MLNVSFSLNLSDVLDFFRFLAVGHETEKWSVYRRYLEFYVLESKLTEFHGKKEPLPTDFEWITDRFLILMTILVSSLVLYFQEHFWFHFCLPGTFADAQLPSKRIIGPKNYEFLTSKREEFEEYLQVTVVDHYSLFVFGAKGLFLVWGEEWGLKCYGKKLIITDYMLIYVCYYFIIRGQ